MNELPKTVVKPEKAEEPIPPLRFRPEAFLIVGVVVISFYVTLFDSAEVVIGDLFSYRHPQMWPFSPNSTLIMGYEELAYVLLTLVPTALAPAFFYLQWRRGFYSIGALLGLTVVSACVFGFLCIPSNDVLKGSLGKDLLAVPYIVGGITLIFIPLHLAFKLTIRSAFSRKRLLDRP